MSLLAPAPMAGPPQVDGATRVAAGALLRSALRGDGARGGPHLLVRSPGVAERPVALSGGLTLGRGPEADLPLADPAASRLHARIWLDDDGASHVEDLGSKNGLLVNGRRPAGGAARLEPGDEVTIGATRLRFFDPLAAAASSGPSAPPRACGASPAVVADAGASVQPGGAPPRPAPGGGTPGWILLAGAALLLGGAALLLLAPTLAPAGALPL